MKDYRKRIADAILLRKLEGKGAVLIGGPRWCGKTTTAEQIAASALYMDDPQTKEQNITMMRSFIPTSTAQTASTEIRSASSA